MQEAKAGHTAKSGLGLRRRIWLGGAFVLALAACGGGGGGGAGSGTPPPSPPQAPSPPPPPAPPPMAPAPAATEVQLDSQPGDPIGQGRRYAYSLANATITLSVQGGHVTVLATGDEDWQGNFRLPSAGPIQVGRHDNVGNAFGASATTPAMRWFGGGRGCAASTGWMEVTHVLYGNGGSTPSSLILRFERFCDGAAAPLRGEVRWLAGDTTRPPAPVVPAPGDLWRPPAGSVPGSGNYVFLQSEEGDPVGAGQTQLFTAADSMLNVSGGGDTRIFVSVWSNGRHWISTMQGPDTNVRGRVGAGYHPEMTRYPFINPTRGGISWVGDGRGCADARGWMVVDRIEHDALGGPNSMAEVEIRFEQRCVGSPGALRGALRWSRAEAQRPPVVSPPGVAGAWRPPADAMAAQGNALYLEGDAGEAISAGLTHRFDTTNAVFNLRENAGQLVLEVASEHRWHTTLRAEAGGALPRVGVYTGLGRGYGDGDPTPHFSLTGRNVGCADTSAWLAVDEVDIQAGRLRGVLLRFEQRCGPGGALRGQLRWRADDPGLPPPPAASAPAGYWRPAPGSSPANINYLLLDSMRSDHVGAGIQAVYTQANSRLSVRANGNLLEVRVEGDQHWQAQLAGPTGYPRLTPGYYPSLQSHPFHNRARGGLAFGGEGRGCNTSRGGFVVDDIQYDAQGELASVSLRLEQHCEGTMAGALWAELRWRADDTTEPPGPREPPADLWAPPAGALPASGSYVYFESTPGEFIGQGMTRLVTPADASFTLVRNPSWAEAVFSATPPGSSFAWQLAISPMFNRPRLQRGFYGPFGPNPIANPARGRMDFSGDGRGCNSRTGWFVVDEVTYVNDAIVSLAARFEQNCDDTGLLRGAIRWAP